MLLKRDKQGKAELKKNEWNKIFNRKVVRYIWTINLKMKGMKTVKEIKDFYMENPT